MIDQRKVIDLAYQAKLFSDKYPADASLRFAELIVRECASIAKTEIIKFAWQHDAENVAEKIMENFGLK